MKIAKEALPFVAAVLSVSALGSLLLHPAVGLIGLPPLLFTLWFFRDPDRSTPEDPDALIAPADGRIIQAAPGKVSIFMNVFNVHVCRAPQAGTVESVEHLPGRFLAAFKDCASEQNERVSILLADGDRRVRFNLVAGLIAKRIVCKVRPGQRLAAGERVGLIRFGSRVDVYLPEGADPGVEPGRKVRAGETAIARYSRGARDETPENRFSDIVAG